MSTANGWVPTAGLRSSRYRTNKLRSASATPKRPGLTSPDFAKKIEHYGLQGKSSLTFVIGGSLGLAPEIEARAHWDLSFSKMTFPHQLFRVMLLEQVYRAFKIIKNETYHK